MSTHYRQQFNFTLEGLESAKGAIDRLRNLSRRLHDVRRGQRQQRNSCHTNSKLEACFGGSLDDDLDIGTALASLFDFVHEVNALLDEGKVSKQEAADIGGLLMRIDEYWVSLEKVEVEETLPSDVDALVQKRETARKAKDWRKPTL